MQHWGIDLDRKDRCLLDYEARNKILVRRLSLEFDSVIGFDTSMVACRGANCLAIAGNGKLPVSALRIGADRVVSESYNAV